jgi:hypothetical protein
MKLTDLIKYGDQAFDNLVKGTFTIEERLLMKDIMCKCLLETNAATQRELSDSEGSSAGGTLEFRRTGLSCA